MKSELSQLHVVQTIPSGVFLVVGAEELKQLGSKEPPKL